MRRWYAWLAYGSVRRRFGDSLSTNENKSLCRKDENCWMDRLPLCSSVNVRGRLEELPSVLLFLMFFAMINRWLSDLHYRKKHGCTRTLWRGVHESSEWLVDVNLLVRSKRNLPSIHQYRCSWSISLCRVYSFAELPIYASFFFGICEIHSHL